MEHIRGINIPEREWRLNHFVTLFPTYEQNDSSSDIDLDSLKKTQNNRYFWQSPPAHCRHSSDIDLSDSSNNNIAISNIIQSLDEFSDSPLLPNSGSPVQIKKLNSVVVGPGQNSRYLKMLKLKNLNVVAV